MTNTWNSYSECKTHLLIWGFWLLTLYYKYTLKVKSQNPQMSVLLNRMYNANISTKGLTHSVTRTNCYSKNNSFEWMTEVYCSCPPLWSIRLKGGKRLADLVDQLTLECCHSFWFYGSCRKRIPIRDSSMPKRILSQCGVSSAVFIGLIVPTTCSFICWD